MCQKKKLWCATCVQVSVGHFTSISLGPLQSFDLCRSLLIQMEMFLFLIFFFELRMGFASQPVRITVCVCVCNFVFFLVFLVCAWVCACVCLCKCACEIAKTQANIVKDLFFAPVLQFYARGSPHVLWTSPPACTNPNTTTPTPCLPSWCTRSENTTVKVTV